MASRKGPWPADEIEQIAEIEAHALEKTANLFESDAKRLPLGVTYSGGALHGASIYNVNMWAAKKLRELAGKVRDGLEF